ncbi:MAG: hypothetical protein ACERKN_11320 [Velocimicrobium sp.]
MKRIIVNIMSTMGISLVILSMIGIFSGAQFLCIDSVFQLLGANIVIHLGLILTNKFESKYLVLESFLDISYIIGILLAFGFVFDWYSYTPTWVLVIMALVVYLIGCAIRIFRVREDVKIVNELLWNRNRQIL